MRMILLSNLKRIIAILEAENDILLKYDKTKKQVKMQYYKPKKITLEDGKDDQN